MAQLNWGSVGKRVASAIASGTDEGNAGKLPRRKVGSVRKGIRVSNGKMRSARSSARSKRQSSRKGV